MALPVRYVFIQTRRNDQDSIYLYLFALDKVIFIMLRGELVQAQNAISALLNKRNSTNHGEKVINVCLNRSNHMLDVKTTGSECQSRRGATCKQLLLYTMLHEFLRFHRFYKVDLNKNHLVSVWHGIL